MIQNKKVLSKDGTAIAFEQSGKGPAIILIASALSDRSDTVKFAKLLSTHFTVINYDRRGRGASGDTKPYAIEREIEDIEALINEVGGKAALFGSSSGAVLALDVANKFPTKVKKLVLFEPPFIVDNSRSPIAKDFSDRVKKALAADRKDDVVKLFMSEALGIPAIGVFMMRIIPGFGWGKMRDMAATLPYDLLITEGTQSGHALPSKRWASVSAQTLILTGEKSETFFHSGAKQLAGLLQDSEHHIVKGAHHGSVVMAPASFVAIVESFLKEK